MASRSKSLELVRGSDTEHVPQHLSCTLECEHLSYWVDARTGRSRGGEAKQLLRNVSIRVAPGEILAIIGPSGAGKSTLLDVLAYRKKEGFLRGRITLNGNDLPARLEDSIDYRRNTGFVSQGDLHLPGISVRETISFTASLRLDADASPEMRAERVELLLSMCRLGHIANNRVGKTLTDGERKRLSVAVEMVALPTLQFYDEPTTGLDAPTAYDVLKSISMLAQPGPELDAQRTVCLTIHQPSAEVFALCSKVAILASGRLVFWGPVGELVPYFSSLDFEFEEGSNPADFAVAVAGGRLLPQGRDLPMKAADLASAFEATRPSLPPLSLPTPQGAQEALAVLSSTSRFPSRSAQFRVLLERAWLSTIRTREVWAAHLIKAVVVGLTVGLIYKEVFAAPSAPWIVLFDEACSVAHDDQLCLVDIPRHSNVSCVFNDGKCSGNKMSGYGAPYLKNKVAVQPVCSIARALYESGAYSSVGDACAMLSTYAAGRGDGACVLQVGSCVAGPNLGSRLSPAAMNACSMFYLAILYMVMGNLQEIPRLFETKLLFSRELSSGAYTVLPLWLSQLLVNLPLQTASFSVFFNLAYWMIGQNASLPLTFSEQLENYIYCYIILLSTNAAGFAYAQLLAVSGPTADWGLSLFPPSFLFLSTFSGFNLLVSDIPFGWRWGRYVSFVRWGFEALVTQVFGRLEGAEDVVGHWGFSGWPAWYFPLVLFGYCAVFNGLVLFCSYEPNSKLYVVNDAQDGHERRRGKWWPCSGSKQLDAEPGLNEAEDLMARLLDARGMSLHEQAAKYLSRFHPLPTSPLSASSLLESSECSEVPEGSNFVFQDIRLTTSARLYCPSLCTVSTVPYARVANDQPQEVALLQGVSGRARPGEILALMGSSGAGKTSLLRVLAGQYHSSIGQCTGTVKINGVLHDASVLRERIALGLFPSFAYIPQESPHLTVLTVSETVAFSVALRLTLPSTGVDARTRHAVREHRVNHLLDLFGLRPIQHLFVKSPSPGRGLSGGELKRLTIATEIVNLPSLIFLDEPTSGLDSTTAHEVSSTLRSLADQNRTVILTAHQPSVATFSLFDKLLLLAEGSCAYFGPVRAAVPFFHHSSLGLRYKPGLNPADFLVAAVSSISSLDLSAHYLESDLFRDFSEELRVEAALEETMSLEKVTESGLLCNALGHPSSFAEQVRTLVTRNMVVVMREPRGLAGVVLRHILVGSFFGSLYRVRESVVPSPHVVASLLFFSILFLTLGHQHSIPLMYRQQQLWSHEREARLYSTRALYVSELIMAWPVHVISVLLYSIIVYTSCGLRKSVGAFFYFYLVLSLESLTSLSLCELVAVVCSSSQTAITAFLPISFYFVAFGGYLVLIPTLPGSVLFLPATSYIRWAFQGLFINEYELDDGNESILSPYGFQGVSKQQTLAFCFGALLLSEAAKFAVFRFHSRD